MKHFTFAWRIYITLTKRSTFDSPTRHRASERGFWKQHSTSLSTLQFPRKQDCGPLCSDVDPFTHSAVVLWSRQKVNLNVPSTPPFSKILQELHILSSVRSPMSVPLLSGLPLRCICWTTACPWWPSAGLAVVRPSTSLLLTAPSMIEFRCKQSPTQSTWPPEVRGHHSVTCVQSGLSVLVLPRICPQPSC